MAPKVDASFLGDWCLGDWCNETGDEAAHPVGRAAISCGFSY
ncbi:MAG: hypothetical protein OXE84_05425 [Rhodobacteraceae bacterium]|nr:hypothetical protein [Paracoccaceae bacterium]MCY4197224.1 hypothetical protein [Paracoccaceae bacterium]MCY4327765.1 hypothetical protein [Paracoccaceae bacterium]